MLVMFQVIEVGFVVVGQLQLYFGCGLFGCCVVYCFLQGQYVVVWVVEWDFGLVGGVLVVGQEQQVCFGGGKVVEVGVQCVQV